MRGLIAGCAAVLPEPDDPPAGRPLAPEPVRVGAGARAMARRAPPRLPDRGALILSNPTTRSEVEAGGRGRFPRVARVGVRGGPTR
jgi:hypothetical protein